MADFTKEMTDSIATLGMEAPVNPHHLWALAEKHVDHGLAPNGPRTSSHSSYWSIATFRSRFIPRKIRMQFAFAGGPFSLARACLVG